MGAPRLPRPNVERAALYNTSTVITLTIGVVVLHATSFVLLLLTAHLDAAASDARGHPRLIPSGRPTICGWRGWWRRSQLWVARWDRASKTIGVVREGRPTESDSGRDSTTPTNHPQSERYFAPRRSDRCVSQATST